LKLKKNLAIISSIVIITFFVITFFFPYSFLSLYKSYSYQPDQSYVQNYVKKLEEVKGLARNHLDMTNGINYVLDQDWLTNENKVRITKKDIDIMLKETEKFKRRMYSLFYDENIEHEGMKHLSQIIKNLDHAENIFYTISLDNTRNRLILKDDFNYLSNAFLQTLEEIIELYKHVPDAH